MSIAALPTRKRSLEELFRAMYHDKRSFEDFARAPVLARCKRERFKHAGRVRDLLVPDETLKGFHEFVRLFVVDFAPLSEQVVYSYRKGMKAFDAVSRHRNGKAFFLCDIANFFPSLNRHRVRETLATARDRSPISDFDDWLERLVDLACPEDALPVGFSTSPGISNAALRAVDDELRAHCDRMNLVVTRYSDDIIVSGASLVALEGMEQVVADVMQAALGGELSLNPGKSKLLHRGMKVKLLGMVLLPDGTISVDASVKHEIEVLLHFHAQDRSRFAARAGNDPKKAEARLSGLINYANTVDQAYLDKLRRKYGASPVDYFLHRSFS